MAFNSPFLPSLSHTTIAVLCLFLSIKTTACPGSNSKYCVVRHNNPRAAAVFSYLKLCPIINQFLFSLFPLWRAIICRWYSYQIYCILLNSHSFVALADGKCFESSSEGVASFIYCIKIFPLLRLNRGRLRNRIPWRGAQLLHYSPKESSLCLSGWIIVIKTWVW